MMAWLGISFPRVNFSSPAPPLPPAPPPLSPPSSLLLLFLLLLPSPLLPLLLKCNFFRCNLHTTKCTFFRVPPVSSYRVMWPPRNQVTEYAPHLQKFPCAPLQVNAFTQPSAPGNVISVELHSMLLVCVWLHWLSMMFWRSVHILYAWFILIVKG